MTISRSDLLLASQLLQTLNPELSARLHAGAGPDQRLWTVCWGISERGSHVGGFFIVDEVGRELMIWCRDNEVQTYLGEVMGKHSEVAYHMKEIIITPTSDEERVEAGPGRLRVVSGTLNGWTHLDGDRFIGRFIERVLDDLYENQDLREAVDRAQNPRQIVDLIKAHYLANLPAWVGKI